MERREGGSSRRKRYSNLQPKKLLRDSRVVEDAGKGKTTDHQIRILLSNSLHDEFEFRDRRGRGRQHNKNTKVENVLSRNK